MRLDDRSQLLAKLAQRKRRATADGPGHQRAVVSTAGAGGKRWDLEVVFGGRLAGADAGDERLQDAVAEAGIFGARNQVVGFAGGGGKRVEELRVRLAGRYDDERVV